MDPYRTAPEQPANLTPRALLHLATAALVFMACIALTYVLPEAWDLRPWKPGEPVPLVRVFQRWGDVGLPAWAGAGDEYDESSGHDSARVAHELGSSVADNLGDEHGPRGTGLSIDPSEYAGIDVHLEDLGDRGMAPFYEALRRTALGKPGALTRVGHYGDSSIATDLITYTLRRDLQTRFGDGGHGFVLISKGYLPYMHRDVKTRSSRDWMLREIMRNQDRGGLYGYGGIQFRPRPTSWATFETDDHGPVGGRVSRYQLLFQRFPHGGLIKTRVDRGPWQFTPTRSDEVEDGVVTFAVPDGPHRLELRFGGHGSLRLYGVVMERDGPGVVYDSLGLVGARAARLLNFDPEHIQAQIRARRLDLLVLGFGGNEASDRIQRERYQASYEQVIDRMRAGREDLGCVIFAPLDQGETGSRRRVVTMPSIPDIVAAQRAAARSRGCAFFDTWQAMGGEGAMGRWYRAHPRLALGDFRHATPAGYEVIAHMFYKAMLEGFARWLEVRPEDQPAPGDAGAGDAGAGDAGAADAEAPADAGAGDAGAESGAAGALDAGPE
ncbi:MAG: hypothetical protein GXP55_14020 [Deltaproteobacteria bacterium]|nr:hypothetical protein [Deltaproteobacteria bacterium]